MCRMVVLVLAAVALAACSRDQEIPEQYEAEFRRQVRNYDRQAEIADQQLKRSEAHADRYEALLRRWEAQTDRYDKILDALEKSIPK